ncbi:MAG: transposase, partial [Planctomycetaceae bacterium]|nr:transposase [Planctomycetaceae bacterium]
MKREVLRTWIEPHQALLSVSRQCELLGLARSSWYYESGGETPENLELMRKIDEESTPHPFFGSHKMAELFGVNRKRVQRLMRQMGIEAIYPKRKTTRPGSGHKIYPYLL